MTQEFAIRPCGPSHSFRRRLALRAEIRQRELTNDVKLVALSFTAFFICLYALIF